MTKGLSEKHKSLHFLIKSLKIVSIGFVNTVLAYKKGSKFKNIFSFWKNMISQLSNALSIVFISLKKELFIFPDIELEAPPAQLFQAFLFPRV